LLEKNNISTSEWLASTQALGRRLHVQAAFPSTRPSALLYQEDTCHLLTKVQYYHFLKFKLRICTL
jgi:hypothetical protein